MLALGHRITIKINAKRCLKIDMDMSKESILKITNGMSRNESSNDMRNSQIGKIVSTAILIIDTRRGAVIRFSKN